MTEQKEQPPFWQRAQPEADGRSSRRVDAAAEMESKIRRARLVLAADRYWPALWLPLGVAGSFVLVSLFGLWALLPHWGHKALLWAFGLAFAASFVPLLRIRSPTRQEALRHLETVSGLKHRPASSYGDRLAADMASGATAHIWAAHRERMARLFSRLKAGWPHPRIDRHDPFALRAALILALIVAFAAHGGKARERLASAFQPGASGQSAAIRLDAWLTPPSYTEKPPIMLADGSRPDEAERKIPVIETPENSQLTIRINHPDARDFSLRLTAPAPASAKALSPAPARDSEGVAEFRATLKEPQTLTAEIGQGGRIVRQWTIKVLDDRPPVISLLEPLEQARRGSLRLRYEVEDDYGAVAAEALLERPREPATAASPLVRRIGEPPIIPLSLPRAGMKSGKGQTYKDLTSHPWAGLPVVLTLAARDEAGQEGRSASYRIILPERQFTKPLAVALIKQRRMLVEEPERRSEAAAALDAISRASEQDTPGLGAFLGIRSVYWRLRASRDFASIETAVRQLWDIAISIEDGDLSEAERDLRAAQENLMQALEQGASEDEIRRLMQELRTALSRFLENLAQRQDNQEPGQQDPLQPDRVISAKELAQLLNNIENLARTGSKDMARQLLGELRDLLENVQTGAQNSSGQNSQMMKLIDGLSDLISRQQQLLDETFRAQQQEGASGPDGRREEGSSGQRPQRRGQPSNGQSGRGGAGKSELQGLGNRQEELKDKLEELVREMQDLGAARPDKLGNAGRAMGEAGKSLHRQNAEKAAEQQTFALEQLRQGAQALAEQLMQSMRGQQGQGSRAGRDPLGRPHRTQGFDPGDSVKVPGEIEIQRAREILDELRRRLGQPSRPAIELDYLERLIRRF